MKSDDESKNMAKRMEQGDRETMVTTAAAEGGTRLSIMMTPIGKFGD